MNDKVVVYGIMLLIVIGIYSSITPSTAVVDTSKKVTATSNETSTINSNINPYIDITGNISGYYKQNGNWLLYKASPVLGSVFLDNNYFIDDFAVRYNNEIHLHYGYLDSYALSIRGNISIYNISGSFDFDTGNETGNSQYQYNDVVMKQYDRNYYVGAVDEYYTFDTHMLNLSMFFIPHFEVYGSTTLDGLLKDVISKITNTNADFITNFNFNCYIRFSFDYNVLFAGNQTEHYVVNVIFQLGFSNVKSSDTYSTDDNVSTNTTTTDDYRSTGDVCSVYFEPVGEISYNSMGIFVVILGVSLLVLFIYKKMLK